MPGPIKLIVRPSEKNAVLCYAMQQYYLNLIQLFIEVRDMNEDVGLQRLKAVDLPDFFYDESVQFRRFNYDENDLLLPHLLAHILSKKPGGFYVFNISPSILFDNLSCYYAPIFSLEVEDFEAGAQDLKFAVVFQMIAYALLESYRNNPQKISEYFACCLAQCEKFPIVYFPALLVFMDAKEQDRSLIQLTQDQVQRINALIQKPEFAESNFPFVKTCGEKKESVDFSVAFSDSLESESRGNFFRSFLAQIPCTKLHVDFLREASELQSTKRRQGILSINFNAFFGAALVALIGLIVGILLADYFPISIERTAVLFGLLLPSGLALAIMVGITIIKLIDTFWPLDDDFENRLEKTEKIAWQEAIDNSCLLILKGLENESQETTASPKATASPIGNFPTTSSSSTSTMAIDSIPSEFRNR